MSEVSNKSIVNQKDLKGKYVFLRASINVPIVDGEVLNQFRLTRGLATINYLVQQGARVIVCGHVGSDGSQSAKPVADVLNQYVPILFSPEVTGSETQSIRDALEDGQVMMLENVRTDSREKENNADFALELASLADVYVNDAFPVSHRDHASMSAITRYIPSYVGINFVHEFEELTKALQPESPALFLLGGAKFDTKMPLVEKLLDTYDHVFIGGALANDFFKAKGYEVGKSLTSDIDLIGNPLTTNLKVLLPIDVTVAKGELVRICAPNEVHPDEVILDAGPQTVAMLGTYMKDAKMILWNGPLGSYEHGYEEQTAALATLLADAPGYTVVGGGDTVAAIETLCCQEKYNFLSTAGGAMLAFLEKGTLPAITAVLSSPK